jgi:uncharacterized membrane protein YbhN (UPF0104 family)
VAVIAQPWASGGDRGVELRSASGRLGAPLEAMSRLSSYGRSRRRRILVTALSAVFALGLAAVAARYFAETSWPLFRAHPGLLVAAASLSVLGYALKALAWRQLVAANERPSALTLAAANGGASVSGLALPGRFDDVVRIAIVRRFRRCPAGVQTLCLSLGMLGLVDAAALAPLAVAGTLLPGQTLVARLGLALLAAIGLVAASLVFALPRLARGRRLLRFRFGRWLSSRTTSLGDASIAWGLASAAWLVRTAAVVVLLGALGVEFSFALAILYLCASSAAAGLPIGPGGTATQAGAGAAVLIASGVGVPAAVGVAVAVQLLGILVGASIFVCAAAWRSGSRLGSWNRRPQPAVMG